MATEKRFVLILILYNSQKSTIDIVFFFPFLSHLETSIFGSIFSFEKNLCSIYYIIVSKEFQSIGYGPSIAQHKLPLPVYARYFRFYPIQRHRRTCIRVEIFKQKCEFIMQY